MRHLVPLALLATLAACPSYDSKPYLSTQKGLLDADQWAGYGPEQAVAVAIGREFAHLNLAETVDYGRKFDSVKKVETDSLGHRLVVTFNSGWHAQVTPIRDGKRGDETRGVSK